MDEDLKKIAPSLSKINKESLFKVPDDYFDGLTDRIIRKIEEVEKEKLIKITFSFNRILRIAALVVLALMTYFVINYFKSNSDIDKYSKYVFENIDAFDENVIFEMKIMDEGFHEYYDIIINELSTSEILNIIEQ